VSISARATDYRLWAGGALLLAFGLGYALARSPFLVAGLVVGGALLALALLRPLAVVGVMLLLGPIDLSAVTGGYQGLFANLGGLDMNGIRLIGVVISFLAIIAVDRDVLHHALARYSRWYLIFLVYATVTLIYSTSILDGARLLLKLGYPFLISVLVLGLVRSREDLEVLAGWVFVGAIAIILINPLYVIAGGYVVDMSGRIRVEGLGAHQNPFSFYLLVVLLFSVARYLARGQVRYLILAFALGGWIILTLTRITLAAAFVGLIGAALYDALVTRRYRTVGIVGLVGLVIGLPLLPIVLERTLGFVPSLGELAGLLTDPVGLYHQMNWQGRQVIWPLAFSAFMGSPLFGIGLGGSTAILLAQYGGAMGGVIHNEYLRLAVDTGVIGLGLFALAIGVWAFGMVEVGRRGDRLAREFALPAFAGILAWAILSITDNVFDYYAPFTQYIGFLTAGALASGFLAEGEEVEVS